MSALIDELKAIIDEKHLLKHPFYKLWTKGELPLPVLQKYAEQYYHLEKAFPTFLSRMHADCQDFETRQAITENLHDEEHGPENHQELWLRFGESVGATREGMQHSLRLPETQKAIDVFNEQSRRSTVEGTAALAAYESQIPAVASEKLYGLQKHYGINDERGARFFKVHGVLDVKHADEWWTVLDKQAVTAEAQDRARTGVTAGRDALWGFLDGIMKAHMPEQVCAM